MTGISVTRESFSSVAVAGWTEQLAHQTRILPTADECLGQVRDAYANALNWPSAHDRLSSTGHEDDQSWTVDTFATPTGQVRPLGPWLQYPYGFFWFDRYCWW